MGLRSNWNEKLRMISQLATPIYTGTHPRVIVRRDCIIPTPTDTIKSIADAIEPQT